jgi:hypothetical protein
MAYDSADQYKSKAAWSRVSGLSALRPNKTPAPGAWGCQGFEKSPAYIRRTITKNRIGGNFEKKMMAQRCLHGFIEVDSSPALKYRQIGRCRHNNRSCMPKAAHGSALERGEHL